MTARRLAKLPVADQSGTSLFALQFLARNLDLSGILAAVCAKVRKIVDLLGEPKRALADEIFMTPTLLKPSPSPARKVGGALSQVWLALGLDNPR